MHHVLTTAEADFQPDGARVAEDMQEIQRDAVRVFFRQDPVRPQRVEIFRKIGLLAGAQRLAKAAAIEVAPFRCRHCWFCWVRHAVPRFGSGRRIGGGALRQAEGREAVCPPPFQ